MSIFAKGSLARSLASSSFVWPVLRLFWLCERRQFGARLARSWRARSRNAFVRRQQSIAGAAGQLRQVARLAQLDEQLTTRRIMIGFGRRATNLCMLERARRASSSSLQRDFSFFFSRRLSFGSTPRSFFFFARLRRHKGDSRRRARSRQPKYTKRANSICA